MFFNFLILIISLIYCLNLDSKKPKDIVLKKENKIPCLINQKCTSCQTAYCSSCTSCQESLCQSCKYKYKPKGYYEKCLDCDTRKIKILNSFNRNCCCFTNKNVCKLAPYCDSCVKKCNIFCNRPRSILVPRSQGANIAKDLVGWQDLIYACRDCNYITTAHSLEYTQSFRDYRLAQYLFGNCSLNFAGSKIKDRTKCQLIADYFGLSDKFQGALKVSPLIENAILQNQVFFGLNNILKGLYIRANLPIVYTFWDLRGHLKNIKPYGCPAFPECYMGKKKVKATCNIFKALSGKFTFGEMKEKWKYGRFAKNGLSKFGVTSLDTIIGYNYILDELSHFGFYLQCNIPLGNKPNARYIFEPIVGNSKHFELGVGLTGHITLWTSGPYQTLSGYIQANVMHMFKNTQLRSFDFCKNGPLSRYMLLKEYKIVDNRLVYANKLINAINYNTRPSDVEVSIKGDACALLSYRSLCINLDLGYDFYGQNKEKVRLTDCKLAIDKRLFGIKGTQDVCSLEYSITDNLPIKFDKKENKIKNNSTENRATICSSSKPNMAQNMLSTKNHIILNSRSRKNGPIEGSDIIIAQNSSKPRLVSTKDLDIESGTAGACVTHKVFGYINYFVATGSWFGYYLGFGGEFEVEALACNEQTSLNQWGIYIKSGIDF